MKKMFLLLGVLILFAATPRANALELSPESFGLLKDVPAYIQEWHIWWNFPYPERQQPFSHMDSLLTSDREPWRLHWNRNGYPMVGLYDSANPEIIRWQLRCIKATGLDSVAVMLHPDLKEGIEFIQEEHGNMVRLILDIAAEEDYTVFFMDEVAFRRGSVCQDPQVMARRVIRFLETYGSHPGFHRINGKPVYYFQTYGWGVQPAELEAMFAQVEAQTGPVYWMIFGAVNRFGTIPQLAAIVDGANLHRRNRENRQWQLKQQDPAAIFAAGRKLGKKVADMQYFKFDGTSQPWRQTGVAQYGLDGRFIETTLVEAWKSRPDFLMLSSWNDWEEGANIEPGWDFDGFTDDPYLYCKAIAHLRGVEFVPPPPPPREAVHPTIWEKLGYGDGAGPVIDRIERSHSRGGALTVTVRDTMSEVTGLEVVWNGDYYIKAPQDGDGAPLGNLSLKGLPGLRSISGQPGDPGAVGTERLQNVFGFTPGRAIAAVRAGLEIPFPAEAAATLPDTFAVGLAYAFDPENPLPKIQLKMRNREPVLLREPKGGTRVDATLNFTPLPRDTDFAADIWNGWRTVVGLNPRPVEFASPMRLLAGEERIGLVALLGAPREERVLSGGTGVDRDGLIRRFHITLPDDVLGTPGAHFVWLRGRDAAGNWGSPVLYAVPNYEFFERGQAEADQVEPPLAIPGALLADNCASLEGWQAAGNLPATVQSFVRKQADRRLVIGNGIMYRPLSKPVADGNFTLSFEAAHTAFERNLIVSLLDEQGKRGYGVSWDSSRADVAGGTGFVRILRFDGQNPVDWAATGTRVAQGSSGHPAVSPEPARFTLIGRDGLLQVYVNGALVAEARDEAPLRRFDRVYLRGNQSQVLNNIVVTSP